MITGGAIAGSTEVRGSGVPNGTDCIKIFDCGTDRTCGNGSNDDILLGMGSTDRSGVFSPN